MTLGQAVPKLDALHLMDGIEGLRSLPKHKIVALMGDLPRVELFARQTSPGWDVWGNEVEPTIPDFGTNCPKLEVTD